MNIVIQSPDEASAAALSTTLNKVVAFAKQMLDMEIQRAPEVAKFIGDTDALAKAFTPKVEGSRLTARLDGDQSMKLTGIILPAIAKARSRASQAVAMHNIRQILLACVIYADGHRGQFPPSLQMLAKSQPELAGMFKHPQMPDKEMPFGYLRPTKAPVTNQVVVYEDWDQHPATLAVGFADGHVETMTYDRFEKLLEQSKARNGQAQ
jgi:prepilin-type processing-associated H-X9-DG protein